jgi:hypothetical protein
MLKCANESPQPQPRAFFMQVQYRAVLENCAISALKITIIL